VPLPPDAPTIQPPFTTDIRAVPLFARAAHEKPSAATKAMATILSKKFHISWLQPFFGVIDFMTLRGLAAATATFSLCIEDTQKPKINSLSAKSATFHD
jgi:hypothetical protein